MIQFNHLQDSNEPQHRDSYVITMVISISNNLCGEILFHYS